MTKANMSIGQVTKQKKLSRFYNDGFYESQVAASLRSARIFLSYLWQFVQPASVLDVGCGRGTWLKICHDLGSNSLYGFDGQWNKPSLMIDPAIEFRSTDLNQPFAPAQKVDLAMSLEVAEHLEPKTAPQFVQCLGRAADMVLFSAAYTHQGGTNHITEQPPSYWAALFHEQGFAPYDLFRPVFWGNDDVCFWYRQNAFLYLKEASSARQQMEAQGFRPLANTSFLNCIHPALYHTKVSENEAGTGFKKHLRALFPSFINALRRRLARFARRCINAASRRSHDFT